MLSIASIVIIWRTALTVKRRIYQWTQKLSEEKHAALEEVSDLNKKIQDLENQLETSKETVSSTKQEYEELKESFQGFKLITLNTTEANDGLKAMLGHEAEALKNQLEINRMQKEASLEQKLAQEEFHHRETKLKDKINALEMNISHLNEEQQKKEFSYKTQIKELEEHLKDIGNVLCSTKFENEELKESFKAFEMTHANAAEENDGSKKSLEQEQNTFGENERLKNQVEMMTILLQEKENAQEQKLAQQELHHQESGTKLKDKINALEQNIMEMRLEQEEHEHLCTTQLKATLKTQLEKRTRLLQEEVTTLQHKLAQEEARMTQANEQFVEYREGILQVAKEQQAFLKSEIRLHKNRAHEILMAYHESDRLLANERRKTACLHRMLADLNDKLAECSRVQQTPQTPPHRKDAPMQSSSSPSPSTSFAADQHPAQTQRNEGTQTSSTSKWKSKYFPGKP